MELYFEVDCYFPYNNHKMIYLLTGHFPRNEEEVILNCDKLKCLTTKTSWIG